MLRHAGVLLLAVLSILAVPPTASAEVVQVGPDLAAGPAPSAH